MATEPVRVVSLATTSADSGSGIEAAPRPVGAIVESLEREIDVAGIPQMLHPSREYRIGKFLPSFPADPLP